MVRIAVHKLCSSAITTAAPDTAPSPLVLCNRPPDDAGAQHGPNRPYVKLEQGSDPGNALTAQGLKQSNAPNVSPPIVARQPIALVTNRKWDDNFLGQVTARSDKFILPCGFSL